jgi:hypothetical protein
MGYFRGRSLVRWVCYQKEMRRDMSEWVTSGADHLKMDPRRQKPRNALKMGTSTIQEAYSCSALLYRPGRQCGEPAGDDWTYVHIESYRNGQA